MQSIQGGQLKRFLACVGAFALVVACQSVFAADSANAYPEAGTFSGEPILDAVDRDAPPGETALTRSGKPDPYTGYSEFQTEEMLDAIDRASPPAHTALTDSGRANPYMKYDEFHTTDLLDAIDRDAGR